MILLKSDPLYSVTTNPDAQEAESIRYGNTAFMILPLSSGRVAVLGHMREVHAIVDTLEEACQAGETIPFLVLQRAARAKEEARRAEYQERANTPRADQKAQVDELAGLLGL